MTKKQQIAFVRSLTKSMGEAIVEQIKNGKIPEHWDGIQLRLLVSNRATENANFSACQRAKREVNNTIIVNGL